MRYVEARIEEYNREETYRIYVTACLQHAPRGESMNKSYYDLIKKQKVDTRSGEEVALDIITKAGLHFGVEHNEHDSI